MDTQPVTLVKGLTQLRAHTQSPPHIQQDAITGAAIRFPFMIYLPAVASTVINP